MKYEVLNIDFEGNKAILDYMDLQEDEQQTATIDLEEIYEWCEPYEGVPHWIEAYPFMAQDPRMTHKVIKSFKRWKEENLDKNVVEEYFDNELAPMIFFS